MHPIESCQPTVDAAVTLTAGAIGGHVGLLYRPGSGEAHRLLHLAWHLDARDDEPDGVSGWIEPRFRDDLGVVRTAAQLVASRLETEQIPYAFEKHDAHFEASGTLLLGASAGLTCSSFVLLVFQHARFPLVDERTWRDARDSRREEEDRAAQERIVGFLERQGHLEQADRVRAEIGCVRIRAEEVAAASGLEPQPAKYAVAAPKGAALLRKLDTWRH